MIELWDEQLMWSKYHLSTSKRLFDNFSNYETKRFLSSCLNELALSASSYVNTILLMAKVNEGITISKDPKKRIVQFIKIHDKKLNKEKTKKVLKIFEVKHAQKNSPVEMLKNDKIILLDKGEYKAITKERIKELIENLENCIKEIRE